jgi:putative ABC transport system substrate-binding protein
MDATRTIPIVFATNIDAVEASLVPSLAKPGGNATGMSYPIAALYPKWVELLSQLVPTARKVAMLINSNSAPSPAAMNEVRQAAGSRAMELEILEAANEEEINKAVPVAAGPPVSPLFLQVDQLFNRHRPQIIALASQFRIPIIHGSGLSARAGGLMSYGFDTLAVYRELGVYVGKVLRGAKPAELPVQQPTKFEVVLNMAAAKAQGIVFPLSILGAATETLE